jgi:DNA polymerase-3 subunit gamma/tau
VDDIRSLIEQVRIPPAIGKYKVFIIDEVHMLSSQAFNAFLKTLEEPPPKAIFILATTEPHKFPPTIVSRCQHFVFQAQPEHELVEHLRRVLEQERIPHDEGSLRLIARRAAGSVRDAMSLLGQTLALGGDRLEDTLTREVLGVAGQEAYERLLTAIGEADCAAMVMLTGDLLRRGIDIGFFLRELTTLWRNLFLIRQTGENAARILDVPAAERERLCALAAGFSPAFIHAAWQMTLESQRQVLTSLEPAAALELLLLNLTLLPELVSLETLSKTRMEMSSPPQASSPTAPEHRPQTSRPPPASSLLPGTTGPSVSGDPPDLSDPPDPVRSAGTAPRSEASADRDNPPPSSPRPEDDASLYCRMEARAEVRAVVDILDGHLVRCAPLLPAGGEPS